MAEVLADRLSKQIMEGRYAVKDKLPPEPELMEEFGVGRSTVREAIKLMANSGLLTVKQGAGTFVKQLHRSEPLDNRLKRAGIEDLIEVRELLELKIVEKAASYRRPEHLSSMQAFLEQRQKTALEGNIEACIQADAGFHMAVAESCGNEILLDLYRSVSRHISESFRRQLADTRKFQATQQLHEDLFQQIRAGHPENALIAGKKIIGQF